MADLDTLFLQQMQQMRRQTQLQDSGRGLGLLEFAHMLKVLAVLCYPYLPHKASLVAMFLSETGANTEGVLDQVVGELEREQQMTLSPKASVDSADPLISAHPREEQKQRSQDSPARLQAAPEAPLGNRDAPDQEEKCTSAVQRADSAVAMPAPKPQVGERSQPESEPAICGTRQPTDAPAAQPQNLAAAPQEITHNTKAPQQFEGVLPGLAARPATAAEEAITLLSRRVAEGTSQLKVLEENQRHLEHHLQQLHELRQRHLLQQAALLRQRDAAPEALLRIANIDDIFGGNEHGWPKRHQVPVPDVAAALQALRTELTACEAGIHSAIHELQKTVQVRAAVSSRHQQHELELRQFRQQQRLAQMRQEKDQLEDRLMEEQRERATERATAAASASVDCLRQGADTAGSHGPTIDRAAEASSDCTLPTQPAEAQEGCSLAGGEGKEHGTKAEDCKVQSCTSSTNEPATELRSATIDRREAASGSPQQVDVPEWHDTLCAAWPDLNSHVLGVVPKGELKEAFQLLIDFFELRLDLYQCNTQWAAH